jgi:lysine 2,3-aminomutase
MSDYKKKQQKMAKQIDKTSEIEQWTDWKWHIKHTIRDINIVEKLLGISFSSKERKELNKTIKKFPLAVTPYYLSLIDAEDFRNDPIFRQSIPSVKELIVKKCEMKDPLDEDKDSPVPYITHRYPDRVLLHVSNSCSMYCRHCTRKRKVGDKDYFISKKELYKSIEYIRKNESIRDVLLSGGDPLMLSDEFLKEILTAIRDIDHVEIIRIGSRMPVVLPYRITDELVDMLKEFQPLYFNTHFNHPRELGVASKEALRKLADAGICLGNQTVLLAGVNDCPKIIKKLCHQLLKYRVRPYYLYQCDLSEGLAAFRTPVGKGMEIIESMIGHTSGLAVPTYVIDAPAGGGKIPVMPNYLISWSTNKVILRNYEGIITTYQEPDSYEQTFCDRNCDECNLQLKLERDESDIEKGVGIVGLLSDTDKTITLVPRTNKRVSRRKD